MSYIKNYIQEAKAKKLGIRLGNISRISANSNLLMEEYSRLSDIDVDLPGDNSSLSIGAYSYVRTDSEISCLKSIGRYCSIGRNVVLGQTTDNHPISWVSTSMSVSGNYVAKEKLAQIEHDVWIGHNAVVMAGVSVGSGAVIGCNALITKDVAPYQIMAGNPARVVGLRFSDDQIAALLESSWWNIDYEVLKNLPFGDVDLFLSEVSKYKVPVRYKTVSVRNRIVRLEP